VACIVKTLYYLEREDAMPTATTTEEIRVDQFVIRFLVEAEATAGTATLFEFDVPAGAPMPPAHSHDRFEETISACAGR
jgi:hypothetical protein